MIKKNPNSKSNGTQDLKKIDLYNTYIIFIKDFKYADNYYYYYYLK